MSDRDETNVEALARRALDQGVAEYDAATLSKLHQARERALEKARSQRFGLFSQWWWAVPAATAGLLALLIVWNLPETSNESIHDQVEWVEVGNIDMELLLTVDDVAFYEELDFLLWLDQEDYAS